MIPFCGLIAGFAIGLGIVWNVKRRNTHTEKEFTDYQNNRLRDHIERNNYEK